MKTRRQESLPSLSLIHQHSKLEKVVLEVGAGERKGCIWLSNIPQGPVGKELGGKRLDWLTFFFFIVETKDLRKPTQGCNGLLKLTVPGCSPPCWEEQKATSHIHQQSKAESRKC